MDRFASDSANEFGIVGQILSTEDATVPVMSIVGGSNLPSEVFAAYIRSGDKHKLMTFFFFSLRLQKRCLQKSSSFVVATVDAFFLTKFLVTCLKSAQNRDWMLSGNALRKAVITGELAMQGLLKVLANKVGLWLLIVSYLNKTGTRDTKNSFVE